jgi:hypothetical protein
VGSAGRRWWRLGAATVALLAVACTSRAEIVAPTAADVATVATDVPTGAVSVPPRPAPPTDLPSVAPQPPRSDAELRGDEATWFAPDTTVTVFGLDTALDAHAQPGPYAPLVGYLWSENEYTVTGRARRVADGLWVEVRLPRKGTTGWVDRRFLGVPGRTKDVAADVPAGEAATAGGDALDLGTKVLVGLGYGPERVGTVMSSPPTIRRKATVTFDVREADEAILGERITVIGAPVGATEGRFELERVERTTICARAAGRDGGCH